MLRNLACKTSVDFNRIKCIVCVILQLAGDTQHSIVAASVRTMAAEEEGGPRLADRSWIDVQKKTFTNWVNDKLKETDRRVEDLETDLDDGVTLIRLLEVLAPGKRIGR